MTEKELRESLVDNARKYLGVTDSSHFRKVYNEAIGYEAMQPGWPWCACFVSAMAAESGLTGVIPMSLSCCEMINMFDRACGFVEADDYTPQIGDIIFVDWQGVEGKDSVGKEETDHVGIVTGVSGGVIHCIEGNRSGAVRETGYAIGSRYISGFGLPNYATITTGKVSVKPVVTAPEPASADIKPLGLLQLGSSGSAVKAVQNILNARINEGLEDDGVFGSLTRAGVVKWQTRHPDLEIDGVVGPCTWKSLTE